MRRFACLAPLILAACTPHSDGTCLYLPGDDGTCGSRDPDVIEASTPSVHFPSAAVSDHLVVVEQTGAEGHHLWYAKLDPAGVPVAAFEPLPVVIDDALAVWSGPGGALLTMATNTGGSHGVSAAPITAGGVVAQVRLSDESRPRSARCSTATHTWRPGPSGHRTTMRAPGS